MTRCQHGYLYGVEHGGRDQDGHWTCVDGKVTRVRVPFLRPVLGPEWYESRILWAAMLFAFVIGVVLPITMMVLAR